LFHLFFLFRIQPKDDQTESDPSTASSKSFTYSSAADDIPGTSGYAACSNTCFIVGRDNAQLLVSHALILKHLKEPRFQEVGLFKVQIFRN